MKKLKKITIATLTDSEMNELTGGGEDRSDRRTGDCAFSRKYGVTQDCHNQEECVDTGCYPKC